MKTFNDVFESDIFINDLESRNNCYFGLESLTHFIACIALKKRIIFVKDFFIVVKRQCALRPASTSRFCSVYDVYDVFIYILHIIKKRNNITDIQEMCNEPESVEKKNHSLEV